MASKSVTSNSKMEVKTNIINIAKNDRKDIIVPAAFIEDYKIRNQNNKNNQTTGELSCNFNANTPINNNNDEEDIVLFPINNQIKRTYVDTKSHDMTYENNSKLTDKHNEDKSSDYIFSGMNFFIDICSEKGEDWSNGMIDPIEKNGGKIKSRITKIVHVLVFMNGKSKSIQKACEFNINVVNPLWVDDSIKKRKLQNFKDYEIEKSITEILIEKKKRKYTDLGITDGGGKKIKTLSNSTSQVSLDGFLDKKTNPSKVNSRRRNFSKRNNNRSNSSKMHNWGSIEELNASKDKTGHSSKTFKSPSKKTSHFPKITEEKHDKIEDNHKSNDIPITTIQKVNEIFQSKREKYLKLTNSKRYNLQNTSSKPNFRQRKEMKLDSSQNFNSRLMYSRSVSKLIPLRKKIQDKENTQIALNLKILSHK